MVVMFAIVGGMKLEERHMGITGNFQQIIRNIISLKVGRDNVGSDTSKIFRRCKHAWPGIQSTAMGKEKNGVERLIELRAK